jgi:hypothetical protein
MIKTTKNFSLSVSITHYLSNHLWIRLITASVINFKDSFFHRVNFEAGMSNIFDVYICDLFSCYFFNLFIRSYTNRRLYMQSFDWTGIWLSDNKKRSKTLDAQLLEVLYYLTSLKKRRIYFSYERLLDWMIFKNVRPTIYWQFTCILVFRL